MPSTAALRSASKPDLAGDVGAQAGRVASAAGRSSGSSATAASAVCVLSSVISAAASATLVSRTSTAPAGAQVERVVWPQSSPYGVPTSFRVGRARAADPRASR